MPFPLLFWNLMLFFVFVFFLTVPARHPSQATSMCCLVASVGMFVAPPETLTCHLVTLVGVFIALFPSRVGILQAVQVKYNLLNSIITGLESPGKVQVVLKLCRGWEDSLVTNLSLLLMPNGIGCAGDGLMKPVAGLECIGPSTAHKGNPHVASVICLVPAGDLNPPAASGAVHTSRQQVQTWVQLQGTFHKQPSASWRFCSGELHWETTDTGGLWVSHHWDAGPGKREAGQVGVELEQHKGNQSGRLFQDHFCISRLDIHPKV
ncbi:hypothetical protein H4582DRAFT_2060405 [Lactarius indigo]|nr:hypothetical protein H4582DRAFT_2060405 [Lactarius indigo]